MTSPSRSGPPVSSGRRRAPHLGPERRRPLVLDAALRLFVERGYAGTSMDAIAAAAGVTKPVVYECFPGKEPLFRALLEREEERLLAAVAAAMPRSLDFGDVERLVAGGLHALLAAVAAAPDSWRVVFESRHGAEPAVARRIHRARETVLARLRELVEAYLEGAGVAEAQRKAPVVAELLASAAEGSVRLVVAGGSEWAPEQLAALVARLAVRGLAAA